MPEPAPSGDLARLLGRISHSDAEFLIYDDGFRGWTFTFLEVERAAQSLRRRFREERIQKGDHVAIWSESRPGWVAALWGCLLDGVIVVPVDPHSSADLFHRIESKVRPRVILVGDTIALEGSSAPVWMLRELEQSALDPSADGHALEPVACSGDDVAEIVFTSGTTAEPKGVVITHGNLLANLLPVEREIAKYRRYARPFQPLRILNLLPLSHLFGQSLSLFIPPLVPTAVVFISGNGAREIVHQIHSRKISALVAVPKVLEVLRELVVNRFPETLDPALRRGRWPVRWWRFRRVHRLLGWKFWCFISGGAPLPPELEEFWSGLGFVVVQGYGLTETAPIATLSHPFHLKHGTVGKPLSGVEIKIAPDGEILVRGANVTKGYFESSQAILDDGWFHTGDIGSVDENGHLSVRGRKKEMIVTPEGMNVFPDDVERVLNRIAGVRDSAVVGKDRVHAVLLLDAGANPDEIVRKANLELEEPQRIRAVTVWKQEELPRTPSTGKLRRAEIAETVRTGIQAQAPGGESVLMGLIRKYAPGRKVTPETTLDELGLSSLDRIELMTEMERELGSTIDERAFGGVAVVSDLSRPMALAPESPMPVYNRTPLARALRRVALPAFLLPLTRVFAHVRVSGLEHLKGIEGPVIFASNHQSHLDVPVILAALPARWRYRIAPAMSKEFFDPHFFPDRYGLRKRLSSTLMYRLSTLIFNAFPIPQTEAGTRQSIRYVGELAEAGWSILIFPEGKRTDRGELNAFRPGVGMMASHLHLPVIPIRIVGLEKVLHKTAKFPHPGRVEVRFGTPLVAADDESYAETAQRVESAVRRV